MDNSDLDISIPKPCHKNWERMDVEEKGRFCKACNKTVLDFSGSNKKELIEAITSAEGSVCGRIPSAFLSQVISHRQSISYSKRFLYSVLALLGMSNLSVFSVSAQVNRQPKLSVNTLVPKAPACIEGVIRSENGKYPLAKVAVSVIVNGTTVAAVISDSSGAYCLDIPLEFTGCSLTLKFNRDYYYTLLVTDVYVTPSERFVKHVELWSIELERQVLMGLPAEVIKISRSLSRDDYQRKNANVVMDIITLDR